MLKINKNIEKLRKECVHSIEGTIKYHEIELNFTNQLLNLINILKSPGNKDILLLNYENTLQNKKNMLQSNIDDLDIATQSTSSNELTNLLKKHKK